MTPTDSGSILGINCFLIVINGYTLKMVESEYHTYTDEHLQQDHMLGKVKWKKFSHEIFLPEILRTDILSDEYKSLQFSLALCQSKGVYIFQQFSPTMLRNITSR